MGHPKSNRTAAEESRPLHSIALEASTGLVVTKKGIILKAEAEAKLRERLVLSSGSPELEWAVRSLLLLASRLEKRNGAEAASALIRIACSATQPLSKQASESSARAARAATSQFLGAQAVRTAVVPIAGKQRPQSLVTSRLMKMPRRA